LRALVGALTLWSVVLVWFVFSSGGSGLLLDCMHLVGRSVACEVQQEAINQAWWQYRTLPMILAIAAGYVGIAIVRFRGARTGP
jgi:prepilin signal peptidase PulO-like enzyme (type II secretory pathway)